MLRRDVVVEMTAELQHTLVRATEEDLIVFLLPRFTEQHTQALDDFMDEISERTGATIAMLPHDVVAECQNFTIHDLLKLRESVDALILQKVETLPLVEA